MIALIEGEVRELREHSVVVMAGSFGVELLAPAATLAHCRVGEFVSLRTQLLVRDEQPVLYGFHQHDQMLVFRRLLEVSGVGPKVALGVLSALPVAVIAAAVANSDAGLLTSAPGVGKRTAERIVVELRNRLPEHLLAGEPGTVQRAAVGAAAEDAVAALLALGYRESQVKGVVVELAGKEPTATTEALIRKALARVR
ncbi:MAG TPA: Holliday junction branch migration protein RuvA [Trueperaceae bacterium]|nr:Holliday junction branch migration protein RuvA [Trueperaceae bacterium]